MNKKSLGIISGIGVVAVGATMGAVYATQQGNFDFAVDNSSYDDVAKTVKATVTNSAFVQDTNKIQYKVLDAGQVESDVPTWTDYDAANGIVLDKDGQVVFQLVNVSDSTVVDAPTTFDVTFFADKALADENAQSTDFQNQVQALFADTEKQELNSNVTVAQVDTLKTNLDAWNPTDGANVTIKTSLENDVTNAKNLLDTNFNNAKTAVDALFVVDGGRS